MTPQQTRTLQHLQRGDTLTRWQGLRYLDQWETPSRISELRALGYPIKTKMVTVKNKFGETVRIAKWSLEGEG